MSSDVRASPFPPAQLETSHRLLFNPRVWRPKLRDSPKPTLSESDLGPTQASLVPDTLIAKGSGRNSLALVDLEPGRWWPAEVVSP